MPLGINIKRKDKHKDVSDHAPGPALPPRPEFTFLRSDTYTQEVLSLPEDPPEDSPEPLSPTEGAGGGRRQAFPQPTGRPRSRSDVSTTSRSSDTSKSKDKDRPHGHRSLSERLGLRKEETSANVPQDFHEIADGQYEDGNAREQRATILAKENEKNQITYDHSEFSSSVAGRPAGGSSSNRENLLLDLNDEQPIYYSVPRRPLNEDEPLMSYDDFVGGSRDSGGITEPYTGGRSRTYSQTSGLSNYNRYGDKDLPDGADIVPMSTSGELPRRGMDQEQLKEKEEEPAMVKKQLRDMESLLQRQKNVYDHKITAITKKMQEDLMRQRIEHEDQLRTAKKQLMDMESQLQKQHYMYDREHTIMKKMEGDLVRQRIEYEEQLRTAKKQLMDMENQLQQQQDREHTITKKMQEDLMRQRIEHEEQLRTAMEEKEKLIAEKHGKYQELLEKTMAQTRLRMV
jgi:DNA repair exonuclease SbcCD ATPase subunit